MSVWIPTRKAFTKNSKQFIDEVIICDETSEKAHNLQGKNMRTGYDLGWRDATDGGWIAYTVKVHPKQPCKLILKYWGSDGGNRRFDIFCEGVKIATEHVNNNHPNEYYEVTYPIPTHLTKGKQSVVIRMQALPGNVCGGIFGVRISR
jgi:hypothetical protein